jgi:peroxiredoxin
MSLIETPICNFNEPIKDFSLLSTEEITVSLKDIQGPKGTLIMFICNHCPYVQAIMKEAVTISNTIKGLGIHTVAIMPNDTEYESEDSFDNMKLFSKQNHFPFPYLLDESQEVARKFGAVCTPDFFGYNNKGQLQYRGRIRKLNHLTPVMEVESELLSAMKLIASNGQGPKKQFASMGCSIKWK